MSRKVAVLGTFDTKGKEFKFLIDAIKKAGASVLSIDTGIRESPFFVPDIKKDEIAKAGGTAIDDLIKKNDRGTAIDVMTKGAVAVVSELYDNGKIDAIVSLGGTAGTTIGTTVMRALPVGFPKLMVSTVASGDTRPYVGEKDIIMMNSIVDISGINRISAEIITNAANAIAGMANGPKVDIGESKPIIVATMFGVTTPCVTMAKDYLENIGYEVLVFHATGSGGRAMEALISAGLVEGVLDVTTTEWCDELVGGVLNAGPERLDAAANAGIPQVVSVGALDMVNFGPIDSVPQKFDGRNFYKHNATVTLMRTTCEESAQLGEIIGQKISKSKGACALFLPLKGISMIDAVGMPFYGPDEDLVLFDTLKANCRPEIVQIVEIDAHINDKEFAFAMAKKLDDLIKSKKENLRFKRLKHLTLG